MPMEDDSVLKACARELLDVCLSWTTGIPHFQDVSKSRSSVLGEDEHYELIIKEQTLIDLYDDYRKFEKIALNYSLDVSQFTVPEAAQHTVERLKEIRQVNSKVHEINSQIRTGAIYSRALHEILNKQSNASNSARSVSYSSVRDKALSTVFQMSSQLSDLRKRKLEIQRQNTNQFQQCREYATEILQLISEKSKLFNSQVSENDKKHIEMYKLSLQSSFDKINTLKPVILNIILSSGVDWAENDRLRQIVLLCSNNDSYYDVSDDDFSSDVYKFIDQNEAVDSDSD
ncbi:hypothetical protein V1511DRAFT_511032 [Dipodascopsis uninucleata]